MLIWAVSRGSLVTAAHRVSRQLTLIHGCAVSTACRSADCLQQCAGWWVLAAGDNLMCKVPLALCMQAHTMMNWTGEQEQDPGLWMLGTDDSGHWATKLWSGNAKSCAFGRRSSLPGARTLYGGVEPAGKQGHCPLQQLARSEHKCQEQTASRTDCLLCV